MTYFAALSSTAAVLAVTVMGWASGGYVGAAVGLLIGAAIVVVPWRGHPAWFWITLRLRRDGRTKLSDPITVANDRSAGGVRYQDGIAITAIQIHGRSHRATMLLGSTMAHTDNTLDISALLTVLRHNLGLAFASASVVSAGSRRRNTGDFARVYESFIGTSPYAGQRETWLVLRINACENAEALQWRATAATAALAATQRVAAALCCNGIRARVATATDMADLDRRVGSTAMRAPAGKWHSLRGDDGWLTSYGINQDAFDIPWTLRVDGVTHNITLFPDSTVTASVTLRTPQPPAAAPSTALTTFPGQQSAMLGRHLCGPLPRVRALSREPLPPSLRIPIGSSGVLLGKVAGGDRLLLPLDDPGGPSQVHLAVSDAIAKRIVVRAAASGAAVTVHTTDVDHWHSVRMPGVVITDEPRPVPGTMVSISDGTVLPAVRPDVVFTQTGPDIVEIRAAGRVHDVEMEFFRAENRYAAAQALAER